MKKMPLILLVCSLSLVSISGLSAQFSFVSSVGISPQQSPGSNYIFVNRSTPREEFTFDISQVKASYFIGAGTRYDIKPFFLMVEAQYNKRQFVYDVAYTYPEFFRSEVPVEYHETMHVINLPVSVGVNIGMMEVYSGFLPQLIVSQDTDLDQIAGYSQQLNPIRLGWHTGVAINVAAFRMGLNWQMDKNSYAEHITINDTNLDLGGKSSRLVASVGMKF